MQNISIGATGPNVKLIQSALKITVDGIFGPLTEAAVKQFQASHVLPVDGIVGPVTWAALGLPAQTPGVEGIDVSHWDGAVDWAAVKAAGKVFAFAKATEGVRINDDTFDANFYGMKQNGIIRGAYHFFHPGQDAVAAAKKFLSVVAPQPGDILVLDWETHEGTVEEELAAAQRWLMAVETATGKKPVIYIDPSYVEELGNPSWLADYPLWLADYNSIPSIPAPWSGFTFWQYSESGDVANVNPCDMNVAGGDYDWLVNFSQGK